MNMCNLQEFISNMCFTISYNSIWLYNYLSLRLNRSCNINSDCLTNCLSNDETTSYQNWIGIYDLNEENQLSTQIMKVNPDKPINDEYVSFLTATIDQRKSDKSKTDKLFMVKNEQIWNVRTFSHAYTPLSTIVSHAKFFNIEYIHPSISENIEITIPKSQYIANNDLLSKTYVFNYLQNQSQPYVFDDQYKLQIMDENLNIFEIQSHQYIRLLEGGYVVSNLQIYQ